MEQMVYAEHLKISGGSREANVYRRNVFMSSFSCDVQWHIQGGGAPARPPQRPNFSRFHAVFEENFINLYPGRDRGLASLSGKILDPPLRCDV